MKERWITYAKENELEEMQTIYQKMKNEGLQKEVRSWKDSGGDTALSLATWKGHLDICIWLVNENLMDINSKDKYGENALHIAARTNRPEIASLLLEEGSIDINEQTNEGCTALHIAAFDNSKEDSTIDVIRILLKYKPQLLKDENNETALDRAIEMENEEIIQLLRTHYDI